MKTTIDLEDELLLEAKKRALVEKKSLKTIIEEALRLRLRSAQRPRPAKIRWIVAEGGVPEQTRSREAIYDWMRQDDLH